MSSGIYLENSTDITITNSQAGPCPVCGGNGETIDGVYSTINDILELIPFNDDQKVKTLKNAIEQLNPDTVTVDDIEEAFNEQNLDGRKIMEIVRKFAEDNKEIVKLIGVIIAILNFALSGVDSYIESNKEIDYEKLYEEHQKYIESELNDDERNK